ncbi:MAG TPA: hypothetical protein P5572_13695, partial [Phycisphaerae bacterium]|nr:hypothetical protein [Phycisphaerae bacterium]
MRRIWEKRYGAVTGVLRGAGAGVVLGGVLTAWAAAQAGPLRPLERAQAEAVRVGGIDCNDNGVDDALDIAGGTSLDCNLNAIPDECDIANPSAYDCNANGQVDACEVAAGSAPDCNSNGQPDECDLAGNDCTNDGIPDDCQPDCDGNEQADVCDIAFGIAADCNLNRIPDGCDIAAGTASGNEGNVLDACSFWIDGTGLWSVASNWDPEEVPDNTPKRKFYVTIGNFGADVTLDIDAEIQTLNLAANSIRGEGEPRLRITQGNLTIESTDGVQLDGSLTVGAGHGLIAGTTMGIRGSAPVNLAGGDAFIASRSGGDVMTSRSGIRGFGRISADFINESYLSADVEETQLVVAGPGSKVNNGVFEATGGGTLLLEDVSDLRALDVTGTGDYAALGGTIQLGAGGGSVSVGGDSLGIYFGGQMTMRSAWALLLTGSVFIDGGVFDPDVATTGFLQVPEVRINSGTMNLGAETTTDIGQITVLYEAVGRADAARGLTPPVLNVTEDTTVGAGGMEVGGDGQVNVVGMAKLNVSGAVVVHDTQSFVTRGLTPPVLNVRGEGELTAGTIDVADSGQVDVSEDGSLAASGAVTVGNAVVFAAARGLTPPVLNVRGSSQATAGSIAVIDDGALSVQNSAQAAATGNVSLSSGATRGLTPPVLNVAPDATVMSGGDFSIETSATVEVTGKVAVGGSFQNQSTNPSSYSWEDGTLTMSGVAARGERQIENASEDRGPLDLSGFNSNFAFGVVEIGTNATVRIVDEFDNQQDGTADCDEAAYVKVLIIRPGATLLTDGCKLYFETLINEGGSIPELGTRVIPIGGGDVDSNGVIDNADFDAFLAAYGSCAGDVAYLSAADLDFDGCVTLEDYQAWYALFQEYGPPTRAAARVAGPGADVTVRFVPSATTVDYGDVFSVDVVADIAPAVLGWGLDVTIDAPALLQPVGMPAVGPAWIAAPASDGDGLAALAFPSAVSGGSVVLATLQFVATGLGQVSLAASASAGDLAEGFALDPSGFATVAYEPATITVVRGAPAEATWNWVDVGISLTANQPTYWSAATGRGGVDVPPFTILMPGPPPGQPAADGSGDRVLRGFILAWAVNAEGEEIRWNHLTGGATVVNYERGTSWEYASYAFRVVSGVA